MNERCLKQPKVGRGQSKIKVSLIHHLLAGVCSFTLMNFGHGWFIGNYFPSLVMDDPGYPELPTFRWLIKALHCCDQRYITEAGDQGFGTREEPGANQFSCVDSTGSA